MTSDISVDVPAASWGPLLRDPCGRGAPELGAGSWDSSTEMMENQELCCY